MNIANPTQPYDAAQYNQSKRHSQRSELIHDHSGWTTATTVCCLCLS